MVLIGSQAILYHFPDFPRRPKDWDIVGDGESFFKDGEFVELLTNPVLILIYPGPLCVISPDHLYTLKISHAFWNLRWEKHLWDIQWLKAKGCKFNRPLFKRLYAYWCERHGPPTRSKLNQSSKDFFNNALKKYDHDYLHTLINPIPMYTHVLKDGEEVDVSEEKFNQLTYDQKLELVREEIYVMAYERLAERDYRTAYSWMLKQFVLKHAPIWEALFIIQNHKELHLPIINYKQKLDYGLRSIEKTD